jgi:hypothetical protein
VKLILREEGEPVDSFLLVVSKLGLDGDGDVVLGDFASVEKPFGEELCRESLRVGNASLQRYHLDEGGEGAGCRQPDVVVRVAHATEGRDDHEQDVR